MRTLVPHGGPTVGFARDIDNDFVRLAVADVSMDALPGTGAALDVRIPGSSTIVRVGLGADPETARTILASIRRAVPAN
jgi:hypothetical protein